MKIWTAVISVNIILLASYTTHMLLNNVLSVNDSNAVPFDATFPVLNGQIISKAEQEIPKKPTSIPRSSIKNHISLKNTSPKRHPFGLKKYYPRLLRTLNVRLGDRTPTKKRELQENKASNTCEYFELFTSVKSVKNTANTGISANKLQRLNTKMCSKQNPVDLLFVKKYKRCYRDLLTECILGVLIVWGLLSVVIFTSLHKSMLPEIEMLEFEDEMSLLSIEVLKGADSFEITKLEPPYIDYDAMLLELRNKFVNDNYFTREVAIVPGLQLWSHRFKRSNKDSAVFDFTEPSEQIPNRENDCKYSLYSSEDPPC